MIEKFDNFLPKKIFDPIQITMLGPGFPWFYNNGINHKDDNLFQFVHVFYSLPEKIISPYHEEMKSVYNALGIKNLIRAKANLNVRTDIHQNTGFHNDFDKSWNCKTAIFYINTNNGWTEFRKGDRVDCKENRILIFDSNLEHTAVTCTDENVRVVVNLNYE